MSPVGRTRTLPVGETRAFNLGVFSCSNLPFGWFNAYAHAAADGDFDCALHLGDDLPTVGANLSRLFDGRPVMGLCTYGEQGVTPSGVSSHGNLMYSMLLFGSTPK